MKKFLPYIFAFHVLILIGMFLGAVWPLWFGREIAVPVTLHDPRDLTRGQYVELDYEFSRVDLMKIKHDIPDGHKFHFGDVIYLTLKEKDNLFKLDSLHLKIPDDTDNTTEIYLSVRVQDKRTWKGKEENRYGFHLRLLSGCEAWFASPERAKELEKELRSGKKMLAVLSVTKDGTARIKRLEEQK